MRLKMKHFSREHPCTICTSCIYRYFRLRLGSAARFAFWFQRHHRGCKEATLWKFLQPKIVYQGQNAGLLAASAPRVQPAASSEWFISVEDCWVNTVGI